jgi:hypothetical protein
LAALILVHPFLVRGLLRCLHKKPCRRLAMTGGGKDAFGKLDYCETGFLLVILMR